VIRDIEKSKKDLELLLNVKGQRQKGLDSNKRELELSRKGLDRKSLKEKLKRGRDFD